MDASASTATRGISRRRRPLVFSMVPRCQGEWGSLVDPGAGDQAAVADEHHPLQREALLQLVNLRGERLRIGDIAGENLDRHRAAVRGAEQPEDDLRPVGPTVAAVAPLRELATPLPSSST